MIRPGRAAPEDRDQPESRPIGTRGKGFQRFNHRRRDGGSDDRADLRNKPLMDTDRLIFRRLTFFTFEFYKRNILLQLAQKGTAGRGHDTETCISGQATLRPAPAPGVHIESSS